MYIGMRFTPELGETIIRAVQEGNFRNTAARIAGTTDKSIRNWCKWGEEYELAGEAGDPENPPNRSHAKYAKFRHELLDAEASFERSLLSKILKCGECVVDAEKNVVQRGDYKPLVWVLERRASKNWLVSQKLEHQLKRGDADEGDEDNTLRIVIKDHGDPERDA